MESPGRDYRIGKYIAWAIVSVLTVYVVVAIDEEGERALRIVGPVLLGLWAFWLLLERKLNEILRALRSKDR